MAAVFRSFLLPLLAGVAGLLTLGYSALLYDESRTIERDGLQAPVQAIENPRKFKRSGNDITYSAEITFTGKDGRAVTAKGAITDDALKAFRAGQPTQVRYLPDRPDLIRIVGEEDEVGSWLLVIFACAGLAYGGFGIFSFVKRKR